MVRPADEPDLDGDRAVHGDLGARARRGRRARVEPGAERPDPARRPPRRAHPQLRLRRARAASRRPRSSGSSWSRRRGEVWTWGPEDAAQTVTGSAYDFCLLVTQRVHRADTDLVAVGADAEQLARHRAGVRRPAGSRARSAATREPSAAAGRQLLRLLRRPALRDARDARAAVELDVLTGDYLAELTMLILGRDRLKDPSLGYARTFVRQLEDCLGARARTGRPDRQQRRRAQPRGPGRPAARGRARARPRPGGRARRGRRPRAAAAELGFGGALTANAYLGALRHRRRARSPAPTSWSPAGSPTRRSSSGPAIAHTAGRPTSYDELAGAVVAGHVIECGTQATGGNFSGFLTLPRDARPARLPDRRDRRRRLVRDHQARRHRRRGHRRHRHRAAGLRDPVRALPQPRRHGRPRPRSGWSRSAPDRVRITGVRGAAPPERLKVCVNDARRLPQPGRARAHRARHRGEGGVGPRAARGRAGRHVAPRSSTGTLDRAAAARRRHRGGGVVPAPGHGHGPVAGRGRAGVHRPGGRARAGVLPGLHDDRAAGQRQAVRRLPAGVRRPRGEVDRTPSCTPTGRPRAGRRARPARHRPGADRRAADRRRPSPSTRRAAPRGRATARLPLGTFVHARSGDKGGDANIGLWVEREARQARPARRLAGSTWSLPSWCVRCCRRRRTSTSRSSCCPTSAASTCWSTACSAKAWRRSTRFDPQAKAVGEWLRSRLVDVPEDLL